MIGRIVNYFVLPNVRSDFEAAYLARMNRIATWFFVAHLPVFVLIAWLNQTGPGLAFSLTAATLLGPLFAKFSFKSPRSISIVMGITAMLMGGLLVHFGQGPVQIEMHFYFFVLLALLAVFANPMVIVAAAVTVALHHTLLWLLIPASVFNYDAPLWVVAVHSAFVVLESVAACFMARSFFENVIGLERKVNQRTSELRRRGQEMRRLLDSVQQGFFSVNRDGLISEERSRAANSLLELETVLQPQASLRFSEVLRSYDAAAADWFELGFEDVLSGVMPVELTIDQLPKTCVVHSRSLMIDYSPVMEGDCISGLAITVSDITAEVEREKLAQENRELLAIFEKVINDSVRVKTYLYETQSIINALQSEKLDLTTLRRLVHTLKGNSGAFGLEHLAKTCHDLEDAIDEYGSVGDSPAWSKLFASWEIASNSIRRFLRSENSDVSISPSEYDSLLVAVQNQDSHQQLLSRIQSWKNDRVEDRLRGLAEQSQALAEKLGKELRVQIEDCGLQTCKQRWAEFWSGLVHVVRNAVDHGIESPAEREELNKPAEGSLTLKSFVDGDQFCLSISDDGRGLDLGRIRESAERKGLNMDSQQDIAYAIFDDGVSTADVITEFSGRGIGMAAVKQFTESLGGIITVQSQRWKGTEFRFSFPLSSLASPASSTKDPDQYIAASGSVYLEGAPELIAPASGSVR